MRSTKKWVFGWERKGLPKKEPRPLGQISKSYRQHKVRFVWIKATTGTLKMNAVISWQYRHLMADIC